MSLRVWLPLNGTLDNQGLDNVVVTNNGTTVDNNGKIGKCYYFNGSSYLSIPIDFSIFSTTECSMCVWAKMPDPTSGNKQLLHIGKGAGWTNNRFTLLYRTGSAQVVSSISDGTNYLAYSCNAPITTNQWIHLAVVFGNRQLKIYVNGELKTNYSTTFDISFNDITALGVGAAPNGNEKYTGYLNDVRIYDHALSPMEVKQISQGLILHYPLNNNEWGQENLLAGTNQIFTSGNEFNRTLDLAPIFDSYGLVPYTISFDLKSTDISNRNIIMVYCQNGSGARYSISQNYINNITTEFKKYSVTVTPTLEKQNLTQSYLAFYGNYNTGNKPVVKNIKVELGEKATPWCPNEADELYNKLGLNENIQYDTSGYCNNGIKVGTFQYKSDTPKYDISTYAQGGASTHLEGIILPSEAKTVSLWIKCAKTVNSAIFNDRIIGLQIGLLNSLLYVNSLTSTKGFTTTHWKNNEWNHVVVINDNGTRFCYVNGQAETQSGSSNYYIHNTDKFWLWNRSYNNNYPFKGNLSDLRIYCTVLSLEDILLLYHNSAYIDNHGNIYGAELKEV